MADDTWALFLGDRCGKAAAAVTSLARYTLRAAAVHTADPVVVLNDLTTAPNNEYRGWQPTFCTVLFGRLPQRPHGGFGVTLAGGGHPTRLLCQALIT
ncbi:MAG TPA: SpoIIE family protein phosphatase [Actinophytocola sp.]|uniref:SpoIIE family protein phosphatase n=1 Tax=Actinophytocola sp. TaxID=1872138 RepID=UPI002F91FF5D